ncbi:hypothetical protein C0J52_13731 [Blattella germanica]|nr:hypothetical protein C0J52_13731 [Blattella germanica]
MIIYNNISQFLREASFHLKVVMYASSRMFQMELIEGSKCNNFRIEIYGVGSNPVSVKTWKY